METIASDRGGSELVEGTARVVAVADGLAWLEPEPGSSCGGCAAALACGAKGIGPPARRLELRRFALPAGAGLRAGDRVVVGVPQDALIKGSLAAYAIPLVGFFAAAAGAQAFGGGDALTLVAGAAGLGLGLTVAGIVARRLGRNGGLAPRLLRRAPPEAVCNTIPGAAS